MHMHMFEIPIYILCMRVFPFNSYIRRKNIDTMVLQSVCFIRNLLLLNLLSVESLVGLGPLYGYFFDIFDALLYLLANYFISFVEVALNPV